MTTIIHTDTTAIHEAADRYNALASHYQRCRRKGYELGRETEGIQVTTDLLASAGHLIYVAEFCGSRAASNTRTGAIAALAAIRLGRTFGLSEREQIQRLPGEVRAMTKLALITVTPIDSYRDTLDS